MSADTVVFWILTAVALGGAVVVVFSRDMLRMIAGLAAFLLAVAGFFLVYHLTFLAAVQVFVYVGGVLVMMLFAVSAVRRDTTGRPRLGGRYDPAAFVISIGLFLLMVGVPGVLPGMLAPHAPTYPPPPAPEGVDVVGELAGELLGPMLPHFEMVGVLLLIALVAVVAIVGGRRES